MIARRLKPDNEFLRGNLLHAKMKICDWSNYRSSVVDLCDRIARDEKVAAPFAVIALSSSLDLQRKASEIWINAKYPTRGALERNIQTARPSKNTYRVFF